MSSYGRCTKMTLRSCDGETIVVDESVAMLSEMLKEIIEIGYDGRVIDCGCSGKVLSKVMEYCKVHAASEVSDEELKAFDADFIKMEPSILSQVFMAANITSLDIKTLRDLTRQPMRSVLTNLCGKRSRVDDYDSITKRAMEFDSRRTRTGRVNGIDCIIRENEYVIEYTPYKGVIRVCALVVAAAGEIRENLKLKKNALTFSFPSVGMKFAKAKNAYGVLAEAKSYCQNRIEYDKYYDEAYKEAKRSSLTSGSSSAMKPCTSGMSSSPTIQVCIDTSIARQGNPILHAYIFQKIATVAKRIYRG